MSPHEEDSLCRKLELMIDEKLATRPIRFCAEHDAMKKRTWWGSVKLMTAIATVLGTCAAAVWWVSTKSSEATTTSSAIVTGMQTGFVAREIFDTGQAAQDDKVQAGLKANAERIDGVQRTVDATNLIVDRNTLVIYEQRGLLKAIAGKLNVRQETP